MGASDQGGGEQPQQLADEIRGEEGADPAIRNDARARLGDA